MEDNIYLSVYGDDVIIYDPKRKAIFNVSVDLETGEKAFYELLHLVDQNGQIMLSEELIKRIARYPFKETLRKELFGKGIKTYWKFSAKNIPIVQSKDKRNRIERPPFSGLIKLVKWLPKKYGQNLEQNISDMRIEYYEALAEKKYLRARLIIYLYYVGLGWSAIRWIAERAKELVGFMPKVN